MPAKPTIRELRNAARKADIEDWEEMDRDELIIALDELPEPDEDEVDEEAEDEEEDEPVRRPAKKVSKSSKKAPAKKVVASKKKAPAKKAPAAKKAAPKRENPEQEGPNPFRPGSNLYLFTEALMRGGKRSAMVTKLESKIDLKPRKRGGRDYDVAEELDYRLVRQCQLLANQHGFVIEKEGRGTEQKVKAIPPEDQ